MTRQFPIALNYGITGIGGLPFDPTESWEFMFRTTPDLPYLPEPVSENMFSKLLRMLPVGSWTQSDGSKVCLTREPDASFFDRLPQGVPPLFYVPKALEERLQHARSLKAQVVGPVTLLSCLYSNGAPLLYQPNSRAAFLRWYVAVLSRALDSWEPRLGGRLLTFDEPSLAFPTEAVANTYRSILSEVFAQLDGFNGSLGIHCCQETGWTERWQLLMHLPISFVSAPFSAFALPKDEAASVAFFHAGGAILLGVVNPYLRLDRATATERLCAFLAVHPELPPEQVALTPYCGTSLLAPADATSVFDDLAALAAIAQQEFQ